MTLVQIIATGMLVLAAMILVPIIAWLLARCFRERKRREEIRAIARNCGAEFRDHAFGKLGELAHLRMFAKGRLSPRRRQRIRNLVVRDCDGVVVAVFDYHWKDFGDGEEIVDPLERRTVVHVKSDQLQLPQFAIHPNGLFLKLTKAFRSKITFDCHAEFMRRYDLSAQEEQQIRGLFQADVLDLIATDPRKIRFEGSGQEIIFYPIQRAFFGEGRVNPQEIPALLELGAALCHRLLEAPDHESPASDTVAILETAR